MASMIPFPPARRVDFVRRQAAYMLTLRRDAAERHLKRQVEGQRQALIAKGCTLEAVDAACAALTGAIRVELWRTILTGGNAA